MPATAMQLEYAKVSALGDRSDNQDRAAVVVADDAALMLVFDGMGGQRVYIIPSVEMVIVRTGAISMGWDDSMLPNLLVRGIQ